MKTPKFALAALVLVCLIGATTSSARAQIRNTPEAGEPPPATEARKQTDAVYNASVNTEYKTQMGDLAKEIRAEIADGKRRCCLTQSYDFTDAVLRVESRLKSLGYTVTHTDTVHSTDRPWEHHNYASYHLVQWTIRW